MGRISISSKTENVIGNLNLNYHVAKALSILIQMEKLLKLFCITKNLSHG